jgi:hypothetical protein
MVTEGQQAFASFTIAELERMRDLLDGVTELTDRHRARVDGKTRTATPGHTS